MQLDPVKIKAMPRSKEFGHHAFVCFRSEKEKFKALEKLDGYVWKGQPIKAVVSNLESRKVNVFRFNYTNYYSQRKQSWILCKRNA